MGLPLYLAMTREEFAFCPSLPGKPAWMACHFSPYGSGLTNLPPSLPAGSMLILNDRIPMAGHDPELVLSQLQRISAECLLLDFQRPDNLETADLARFLAKEFHRPVGVSVPYAKGLDCGIFVPPVPPDTPAAEYLAPWQGREIWLEASFSPMTWRITPTGAEQRPPKQVPEGGQRDLELCCHYQVAPGDSRVDFHLWRTREDLDSLADQAQKLGVTRMIGLWQELLSPPVQG